VMGIGLARFGLGVAVLSSVSRLTCFDAYPGQVLADGCLRWPWLLRAHVFLQWVAAPDAPRDRRRGAIACAPVVAMRLAA
jgi:hypothetical protein